MAETAKKISMIPAKVQYDRNVKLSEKKMKVAAYCRVSTELEEQDSSYEAQVEYYTSKISENENCKNSRWNWLKATKRILPGNWARFGRLYHPAPRRLKILDGATSFQ